MGNDTLLQVGRIRIGDALSNFGAMREGAMTAMARYLGDRVIRRNREEAKKHRVVDEDGDVVWGTGQIGGDRR